MIQLITTIQPCNLYLAHHSHNLPPFVLFHSKTLDIKNRFKLQAFQSPFLKLLLFLKLQIIHSTTPSPMFHYYLCCFHIILHNLFAYNFPRIFKNKKNYRAHFASSYFLFSPPTFFFICLFYLHLLTTMPPSTFFSFFFIMIPSWTSFSDLLQISKGTKNGINNQTWKFSK